MSPYNNNKIGYIPSRKIFKNPFFNFMVEFREVKTRKQNDCYKYNYSLLQEMKGLNLKSNQIAEEAGRRWRTMSADQKLPYVEVATRIKKPITPKRKRVRCVNV